MKSPIVRMAIRNLAEHRRKSATVGLIVAVAAFLFILGSSLLETVASGMRKSYQERFTGDLYITAASSRKLTAFGWEDQGMMNQPVPPLPRHADIESYVRSLPGVEAVASRSVTFARVTVEDSEASGGTLLMGVDPEEYAEVFPGAFVLADSTGDAVSGARAGSLSPLDAPDSDQEETVESSGSRAAADELSRDETPRQEGKIPGILVSSLLAQGIGDESGEGKSLLLSSIGTGVSIREVRVQGRLPKENANPLLGLVSYVPIDTVRAMLGQYRSGTDPAPAGSGSGEWGGKGGTEVGNPIASEEELFGSGNLVAENSGPGTDLEAIIAELSTRDDGGEFDPDAYQYIIVRTKSERDIPSVRAALGKWFAREGIEAKTHDWIEGAGMIAGTVLTLKDIFYGIFFVIAAVSLLIIMNALVISVTERTGEIGTMRAIGATKKFVTRLIVSETLMLSGISGASGAALGAIAIATLGAVGIRVDNYFLMILFGGSVFRPELRIVSAIYTLLAVTAIGFLASWYPARVALRVRPSTAMIQE